MSLALDFSGDYATVWDFTEGVRLRRRVPGGWEIVAIGTALRAQPSVKERQVSQGVYQGHDLKWCLPGALLTVDQSPRPGDQVEDSTLTRWTILSADHEQADRIWDCQCVNLRLLFGLRDRCDFLQPSTTQDAAGARTPTFSSVTTQVPARFQPEESAEVEQRGKVGELIRFNLYVEELPAAFTTDWLVRDQDGLLYDVVRWRNAERLDELPLVECERRPGGAATFTVTASGGQYFGPRYFG